MDKSFVPVLGDAAILLKNKNPNRYMVWEHTKNGIENSDCES